MSHKLGEEEIRKVVEQRGFKLIALLPKRKIDIVCPQGHNTDTDWDNFKQGHGCAKCAGNKKLSIEEIREAFEKRGFKLLSTKYKNAQDNNLVFLCLNGHEGHISWAGFKQGNGCQECAGNRRFTFEEVKSFFEKEGYTLLSIEYKGVGERLDYLCPFGHEHNITLSMFRYGQRCPKCHKDTRRHTFKYIQDHFTQQGYTLLSTTYKNTESPLEYECSKKHKNVTSWKVFQQGHRCPECHTFYSAAEKEIADIYKHLNPLTRDRKVIRPFELDVYFPTQKVAVEHNGLYWHSDRHERMTPQYHRKKMDFCNEQNVHLLTIFEDEWLNNKEICTSRINSALGIVQNKVFARKCLARQIPNKEAYEFLKRTHLQGPGTCKVAYGLFYNNQLIQVMTFGSPARAHTSKGRKVLEMKRLAGELNTIIVGGASKLFKVGLQYARQNSFDVIKSYCDLRWGTGNLYQKLGFTKTYETKYTLHYTDGTKRWRNQNLAQNKKKTGKSELEVAQEKGLWKIYDCGHQTWEYKV